MIRIIVDYQKGVNKMFPIYRYISIKELRKMIEMENIAFQLAN